MNLSFFPFPTLNICSSLQNGQTALSIAQRLGYISVVETLKVVTEQEVTTTTTTTVEEKYRVNAPESMQETFMSDSEDEGGKSVGKGYGTPSLVEEVNCYPRQKMLSSKKIHRCSGFDPLEPEGGHGEDDSQAQPILIPGMPYKEVKPYQVWDGPDEARSPLRRAKLS